MIAAIYARIVGAALCCPSPSPRPPRPSARGSCGPICQGAGDAEASPPEPADELADSVRGNAEALPEELRLNPVIPARTNRRILPSSQCPVPNIRAALMTAPR
jgi:hypothetical protein